MANMQSKFVVYVLKFAMHVRKNVKNIHKWIIVSNVLKHVEGVLKNAAEWPDSTKIRALKRRNITSFF
jgi:hypothetical protein